MQKTINYYRKIFTNKKQIANNLRFQPDRFNKIPPIHDENSFELDSFTHSTIRFHCFSPMLKNARNVSCSHFSLAFCNYDCEWMGLSARRGLITRNATPSERVGDIPFGRAGLGCQASPITKYNQ